MKKRLIGIMLQILLVISLSEVISAQTITADVAADMFRRVFEHVMAEYAGTKEVTEQDLYDSAMKGMFEALDDHSTYYPKEEATAFIENISGEFSGIGVMITIKDKRVRVTQVFPNTPAEKSGLLFDDEILMINGEFIEGYSLEQVSALTKGDRGTDVILTIKRGDERLDIKIVRDIIKINPVEVYMLSEIADYADESDNIGYIKIADFNGNMINYLVPELEKLHDKEVETVIVDLRNNTGGYFDEALMLTSYFIPEGVITKMVDKQKNETTYLSTTDKGFKQVVVLVNRYSASASELFTGALKDTRSGIIVGETTYGKSVAQRVYKDGEALYKLTVEEFLTPNNISINEKGIEPDVKVEIPEYIYDIRNRYYLNDEHDDIITAKIILKYLGYDITNETKVYDWEFYNAICKFQEDAGFQPYGGFDYTTQRALNNALYERTSMEDTQLHKAYEVAKYYIEYLNRIK